MSRQITPEKTFGKTCSVKDKDGLYWLVRKGRNHSRVFPQSASEAGEGELVNTEDLENVVDYVDPNAPAEDAPAADAPAADAPAADAPAQPEAATAS